MPTWMIVEDEPDIYEVLVATFQMWGVESLCFVDGESAVAWIDDVDNRLYMHELPEFALLDIRLPGDISGVDIAYRIRSSPRIRHIPLALSTGFSLEPNNKEMAIKYTQADAWWPKPLPKLSELQFMIEDLIARKRPPRKHT